MRCLVIDSVVIDTNIVEDGDYLIGDGAIYDKKLIQSYTLEQLDVPKKAESGEYKIVGNKLRKNK